ncbi:hypothetical protein QCA50_008141 [Cerrena zonata]|uniref:Uncharacterized protein n=1 Tax=Cerrena zonata TaxID=2478898 RepID=A0AAW0G5N5_9APHY
MNPGTPTLFHQQLFACKCAFTPLFGTHNAALHIEDVVKRRFQSVQTTSKIYFSPRHILLINLLVLTRHEETSAFKICDFCPSLKFTGSFRLEESFAVSSHHAW